MEILIVQQLEYQLALDRFVFALMQKKDFKIKSTRPVIICVFDKNKIKEYIEILNKLRECQILVLKFIQEKVS